MWQLKFTVDLLASLASIIAIVTVLGSWARRVRKPLKIERVQIWRKEGEITYRLFIKNRKDYPVEIKTTECYTKKKYTVSKLEDQKPDYSESLSSSDSLFTWDQKIPIEANGQTDGKFKVKGGSVVGDVTKLLFFLNTSHGYQQLWCKNILNIEQRAVDIDPDPFTYETMLKAKIRYYWVLLNYYRHRCYMARSHQAHGTKANKIF